ncbi:TPA: 50S ribosomal protein L23 [Candidatus Woesearchaeota archaeon]|nr:50S ribosomal protein L23 [Candidatus Woesearchaeota archaeon]HII68276.1 50S ribosomal protein L23 [Candidatus Woesearchaeota archaeon]
MTDAVIIKFPISTEKTIRAIEAENTLVFVVDKKARKQEIREAIESLFKVKIVSVNTAIGPDGKKRAYVRFSDDTPAIDVATQFGLL